ncbi:MAG: peptidylprolyl isomerase [Bacillota bacterium]
MAKNKGRIQWERERPTAPPRRRMPVWVWAIVALIVLGGVVAVVTSFNKNQDRSAGQSDIKKVTIETAKGNIVLEVYMKLMPITGQNFIKLVEDGFYNIAGMTFHRVEDWVIQAGDPTGTGMGGSSETIRLEVNPQLKNHRGMVGMARGQSLNSASSQFYILKKDASWLDGKYAVFAKVVEGMDVVDKIAVKDAILNVRVTK